VGIEHPQVTYIHKPEQIPALLEESGFSRPQKVLLENDELTYNEITRLQAVFSGAQFGNATDLLRQARTTKTPWEIGQFRISAHKQAAAYARIRNCYRPGMTDIEFQYEFERECRALGSLGIFRGFGSSMDIFMGSVLTGDNAGAASPFDFALGGGGLHPSIPIGANGSPIKEGSTLMVDIAGNFTAYISDMTRVFSVGKLPDIAYRAHAVALEMQAHLEEVARVGYPCADIYNACYAMASKAGLAPNFMGTRQQAKFVGHGIGLQINELPVLTPRSKELLEENMVFAFEPKFVLPGIGAVGIENSFLVTANGLEKLTLFEESLQPIK
jgi:Xaa-Pro aminopeptidase